MRIAIAGFMHESNTFNPLRTDRAAFEGQSLTFGHDLLDEWRDAHHEVGGFIRSAKSEKYQPIPIVMAWATPAGPVTDEVFDEVTSHLIEGIRRENPDGLLLALHGAMVTESHLDADGEIVARLRTAFGPAFPIAVTLDLHGNLSQRLIDNCDLAVAYRTCPHVDQFECGQRAAQLLAAMIHHEIRPHMRLAKPPLIVNIMAHDTSTEPLRSFMQRARYLEGHKGILAVSLLPGFAYADVPQMGPSVIVITDAPRELDYMASEDTAGPSATACYPNPHAGLARREADALAGALWDARHQLNANMPDAATAVAQALQAEQLPVVLVDTGDNVGGGSAGDGTVILHELLRQGATDSVVCLYAPEEVARCVAAGVANDVALTVGGKVDRLHGDPVDVTGHVRLLHDGTYIEPEVRHGGKRINHMGTTALVELRGRNLLVLNTLRHPPFSLGQLTCLGIEPRRQRILVVKAAIAYKAAYAPIAGTIIAVDTPGLTAVNPKRFTYRHIRRPLFPLD
jgi:microcystin degradation protein MlrC